MSEDRKSTATKAFGTGKRESHDATDFYSRFAAPTISDDDTVAAPRCVDEIVVGDARNILSTNDVVADNSVALVVTSPPYYAGKAYELDESSDHVPSTYIDYLANLENPDSIKIKAHWIPEFIFRIKVPFWLIDVKKPTTNIYVGSGFTFGAIAPCFIFIAFEMPV